MSLRKHLITSEDCTIARLTHKRPVVPVIISVKEPWTIIIFIIVALEPFQ